MTDRDDFEVQLEADGNLAYASWINERQHQFGLVLQPAGPVRLRSVTLWAREGMTVTVVAVMLNGKPLSEKQRAPEAGALELQAGDRLHQIWRYCEPEDLN